jgi:predicted metalloprotease with PDZ domain
MKLMHTNALMVVLLFLLLSTNTATARDLTYNIQPLFVNYMELEAVQITLVFEGDTDGQTQLALPNQFGAAQQLYRGIRQIRVNRGITLIQNKQDSAHVWLRHAPNATIELSYFVYQDFAGSESRPDVAFRPLIQTNFFQALGAALFVVPAVEESHFITLKWSGIPSNWLIHNSFGSAQQVQQFNTTDNRWLESVFVGGDDWQKYTLTTLGQPIEIVVRGEQAPWSTPEYQRWIARVISSQRLMWADTTTRFYTIICSPRQKNSGQLRHGIGHHHARSMGVSLQNSFWIQTEGGTDKDFLDELTHILPHELMHEWIGIKIRPSEQANDMRMAWFTEGFTEYLSIKAQLRYQLIDSSTYADQINRYCFTPLWNSPYSTAPNALITKEFFTSEQVRDLAYARGSTIAWHLDQRIIERSKGQRGLEDVLRDCLQYYGPQPDGKAGPVLEAESRYFNDQISAATGLNARSFLEQYITNGQLIPMKDLRPAAGFGIHNDSEIIPRLFVR